MKVLTIGDLHGLPEWKKVIPEQFDKIVFLGDYLDSFHVSDKLILQNLKEIIAFKGIHPERVVLLWGNHETSYLYRECRASGYRPWIGEQVKEMLTRHMEKFKMAFQVKNYLWTHAGLHSDFYDRKIKAQVKSADNQIAYTLDRLFEEKYLPVFEVGPERGGRDYSATGGPLWIDKSRLLEKPLPGFHQIVGHTPVKTIEHYTPYQKDPHTSVTFCDCIERGDRSLYELIL